MMRLFKCIISCFLNLRVEGEVSSAFSINQDNFYNHCFHVSKCITGSVVTLVTCYLAGEKLTWISPVRKQFQYFDKHPHEALSILVKLRWQHFGGGTARDRGGKEIILQALELMFNLQNLSTVHFGVKLGCGPRFILEYIILGKFFFSALGIPTYTPRKIKC